MQSKLKPIFVALALALASNSHAVWAEDSGVATSKDEQTSAVSKPADEAGVTEMPPIQVTGTAPEKSYVEPVASTGTKTDTPIMETPLNIQVVPQQVLQDQNATTLEQAIKNVSGVKSSSNYGLQEQIFMRGFSTTTTFRNGFRIDDIWGNGLRVMTNVDSVEVLKGPAAILYGRVEPGGVVNLETKQPQAVPYYSLEQQVGSWDHYLTNLDATGPANEERTFLYRINVSYDKSNSWRNGVTNERTFIAPNLQWRISPRTQMTLEAEYNHNLASNDASQFLPYDTASKQFVQLPRNQNLSIPSPIAYDSPFIGFNWSHQFDDDWSIKYKLMGHEVKSLSDFYYVNAFNQVSPTSWTVDRVRTYGDGDDKITATVLDLTGHFDTAGAKHTLLLGADYYQQKIKATYGGSTPGLVSTTDAFNPAPPSGLAIDPATLLTWNSATDNYGVYVQDQIKFRNNVQVLGGLRYQKVNNTSTSTDPAGVVTPDAPQSDSATTPRVGILWQTHDWLSLYGNYTENFGANTGRDWQGNSMRPESAQQKEIGVKAVSFGGKLRTGLAYFDLTKQNVATADLDPAHASVCGVPSSCSIAIGEVQSKGTELDIQGEIQPGWNVIATYAHTDIRITKSNNGDEGLRMANVPEDMVSLWTTYEFKHESLHGWKVGGGATYRSSATDSTNTIDTPGFTLVNTMAAYEFKAGKSKVTAQFNINNLFNKSYVVDAWVPPGTNYGQMQFGTPRSSMASLKVEL